MNCCAEESRLKQSGPRVVTLSLKWTRSRSPCLSSHSYERVIAAWPNLQKLNITLIFQAHQRVSGGNSWSNSSWDEELTSSSHVI